MTNSVNIPAIPRPVGASVKRLKNEFPALLLDNERVDYAYRDLNEEYYFTSHRILILDIRGVTGRKVTFRSMPYQNILCVSCKCDNKKGVSTLQIFCGMSDADLFIDFASDKVDIYAIQCYLGPFVFRTFDVSFQNTPVVKLVQDGELRRGLVSNLLEPSTNDDADNKVLHDIGVLIAGEVVHLIVKSSKSSLFFTNRRCLYINILNSDDRIVEYLSLRYNAIKLYDIQALGNVGRDKILRFWTNIGCKYRCISIHLNRDRCNIKEVMVYLNRQLLCDDIDLDKELAVAWHSNIKWGWLQGDIQQMNSQEMDEHFHNDVPILELNETCELAFKGSRDLVLLTNKRIVIIETHGFCGKKVGYLTLPYGSIKVLEINNISKDNPLVGEVSLFTEVWYEPQSVYDTSGVATPERSCITFEFEKTDTDILSLIKYMSTKMYMSDSTFTPVNTDMTYNYTLKTRTSPCKPSAMEELFKMLSRNELTLGCKEVSKHMSPHGTLPILDEGAIILMAFKYGRSSFLFSTINMMELEVKPGDGGRMYFRLMPYNIIKTYSIITTARAERECSLSFNTQTPWMPKIIRHFYAGPNSAISIQALIAARVLGPSGRPSDFAYDSSIKYINEDTVVKALISLMENPSKMCMETQFKTDIPVFQADETIDVSVSYGREYFVLSNKRVFVVDLQSMSHRRLEFRSYPLKYINHFEVSSQGHLRRTVKGKIYSGCLDGHPLESINGVYRHVGAVCITKKHSDIFGLSNSFSQKILRSQFHEIPDRENKMNNLSH